MPLRRKNVSTETGKFGDHEVLLTVRTNFTAAQLVNAPGAVLLPATSRGKYRLVDVFLIANGGAAGGSTGINIYGTQAGAKVALLTTLVAGLTQSTVLDMGTANATVLANGASYAPCDANTPITVERIGGALTGATSIDVNAIYALESASMSSGV